MQVAGDAAMELAQRLRSLRENQWPHHGITQAQLAEVFGGRKPLSVPLISSWESLTNPKTPPPSRLEAYARFFATERSLNEGSARLLELDDLTPVERQRRDQLLDELTALREAAVGSGSVVALPPRAGAQPDGGLLHFPADQDITVVCGQMPEDVRPDRYYTDPNDPDYEEFFSYADPRALLELYGYLCAVNPTNQVNYRISQRMTTDDYSTNLVLIGGVDWNDATRDLFERVTIPIRQLTRRDIDDDTGTFEVTEGGKTKLFHSTVRDVGGQRQLVDDVVHFYRGPNPYNAMRTVTFFNGNYSRGTLGAVRALIDPKFRDRNDEYRRNRFAGSDQFSVLTRVPIVNGRVITPDWTVRRYRLHEWPGVEVGGAAGSPTVP